MRMSRLSELFEAIVVGDRSRAATFVQQALDEGTEPAIIIAQSLMPAMEEVGKLFMADEYFLPEMMISSDAMNAALTIVRPLVAAGTFETQGKVVLGTVQGDLHDLGKNIVKMMLEGASFEVVDAGIDVPPTRFVELVRTEKPDVIGLSALLTTTMPYMRDVIISLREAGLRDQVGVVIGGGPVTLDYADDIGADGYAPDAPQAVALVKRLMGLPDNLKKQGDL